ncbi:Integral membrane protein DVU_0534 [Olavius algarvensis associated proteobacterium Delta 3]|nr:Integral membrane protein DVU_0534 [Olavius algarvensis associated proteobacterium Delta 3]
MSNEGTTAGKFQMTPFNMVAGVIVILGVIVTILRFTGGLGAVTNLTDYNPWGIWIGFDLLVGVALAAGGFVTSAAVYIFGLKKYHSAVRPAILTAFLGYALVVLALHYDVGRPWRLPYPFIVQQGTSSVLFEVGACVALYLTVLFIEWSPTAMEWLGLKKIRGIVIKLTLLLTIFGVILSTLHQSSLGALFLIAPSKLHPLWYSKYIPIYFFVSAVIAGLSMVIFESTLSHRYFHDKMDETHLAESRGVTLGFGKAAAYTLAGYFLLKVIGVAADNDWHYLATGYGAWFLVELLGFIALPCFVYAVGVREKNTTLIRWAAAWTVLGIILNRFNISLIAFNYHLPASERYFPHWMEVVISVFIVTLGLVLFRFIATRMPIFYEAAGYDDAH